jgi:hypothetical protein
MPGGGFRDHPENINRRGRPKKGETFTDVIMTELDKQNVLIKNGDDPEYLITAKEAVARKLVSLAVADGNFYAIKYLMDRVDGSPRQSVSLSRGDESLTPQEIDEYIRIYERELSELDKTRDPDKPSANEGKKTPS